MQLVSQWSLARSVLQLGFVVQTRTWIAIDRTLHQVLLRAGPLLEHLASGGRILLGRELALLGLKRFEVGHDLVDLLLHVEKIVGDLLLLRNPGLPLLLDESARGQRRRLLLQVQAGLLLELQAEVFVGACRVQLLDIGVLINNVSRELLEVEAGVLLEGDTLSRYRRRLVTELVLGASLGCTELRLPRIRCIPSAFTRILRILLRLCSLLLLLVEEVDMARGS